MSKRFSGRIHDPNHTLSEYDIYFNDDLVSGTGVYTVEEIADIFGSGSVSGNPIYIADAAPMNPILFTTKKDTIINIKHFNKNMLKVGTVGPSTAGITFDVSDTGEITMHGTATADVNIYVYDGMTDLYTGLSLKVNGCPAGGATNTYRIQVCEDNIAYATDSGSGASFTGRAGTRVRIRINSGVNVEGLVFKPMITLASETDMTFVTSESKEYDLSISEYETDPVNVMDYEPVELFEGTNIIISSSGSSDIEYVKK